MQLIIFQAIKFGLVGALNTFIDLVVLNLLIFASGISFGLGYSIFKGISFTAAVINSYFLNKFWTFGAGKTEGVKREFSQFFIVALLGFAVNVGVASLTVNVIGPQFGITDKLWANVGAVLATLAAMALNFLGYKLVVFKK